MGRHIIKHEKKKKNNNGLALGIRCFLIMILLIIWQLIAGNNVKIAVTKAKDAVYAAIANPLTVGHKFGPINHWDAQKELH